MGHTPIYLAITVCTNYSYEGRLYTVRGLRFLRQELTMFDAVWSGRDLQGVSDEPASPFSDFITMT